MKFPELVTRISEVDGAAPLVAGRTLQQVLSLRNWIIGASIVEFEQAMPQADVRRCSEGGQS